MKCKVCDHRTENLSRATIANKFVIDYFRCPNCGFIQTEDPYWLEEVYSSPIADTDIGLLQRETFANWPAQKNWGFVFDKKGLHPRFAEFLR